MDGIRTTAKPILKNSLGIKGYNPPASALSYPIIDPRSPTPIKKIIKVPIDRDNKLLEYD